MFGYEIDPRNIRPQDVDRATEQARQAEDTLADVDGLLAEITGTGQTNGGHVSATVTAEGRVLEVTVGQQAVRKGADALREAIFAAVGDAQSDAQSQVDALLREQLQQAVPGLSLDPAELQRHLGRLLD